MCEIKSKSRIIIYNTAAHSFKTHHHHTKGQHQEGWRHQPKVNLAPEFIHSATRRFGKPIIDRGKEREDKSTENRIVEVTNDPIGVMKMEVKRNRCIWRPGKTTQ